MATKNSNALAILLAGAAQTRIAHGATKAAAFGSTGLRFRCKRDANAAAVDPWATGTEFYNASMAGPLVADSQTGIVNLGALSGVTVNQPANLATGASVYRITDATGTIYEEGTIGLPGSGCSRILSSSPDGVTPIFVAGATSNPPSGLPLGSTGITITPGAAVPATLPATIYIDNTSGTAIGADYIPQMIGHPFGPGNVPAGQYPKFALPDGTNVPYTMFNKATWDDGSLRLAAFLLRVPAALAANATVAITITSSTTAPAATSARSLADLSSGGTDLNVTVTGLENLAGTWVSSLNQGAIDADDTLLYGDGAVGKVWRVRQQFMQTGANHGQLECYWYVAALQNAAGGLYGIRYLGRVTQPWFDIDIPAKTHRVFASFLVKNGATLVRDSWAAHASPVPFTYPINPAFNFGDGDTSDKYILAPTLRVESDVILRVAGTTLPTGLSAGVSYLAGVASLHPGAMTLHAVGGSAASAPAYAGTASGDCTVQAYPYVTHFGSLWTAGSTAKWDYVQAGGTAAADAPARVRHDAAYCQKTGVLPAYENVAPNVQPAYGYDLMTMGPAAREVHTTGEREDIGLLPSWYVRHLLSQRAVDEQVVRTLGLALGHTAIAVYSKASKTFKPINSKTYAGMPASNANFRWAGNSEYTSGFTNPTGMLLTGLSSLSFDHMPCLAAYPCIFTGEPQYLDLVLEIAHQSLIYGYPDYSTATAQTLNAERDAIVNGTHYDGVVSLHGEARTSAWSVRDIAFAAALVPDAAPQCASYKAYFNDLNAANFAVMKDYVVNMAPPEVRTFGNMLWAIGDLSPWMLSYFIQTMAQTVRMTKNADALYMLNHAAKWFTSTYEAHGAWHIPSYRAICRDASGNYVTSMSQVAYFGFNTSWTAGTNLFTRDSSHGFLLENGDVLMWDGGEYVAPAGLSLLVPYYVVNATGGTMQLSLTPGGSPVAVSASGNGGYFFRLASPPTTGAVGSIGDSMAYTSNIRGALKLAQSAGATVSTALIADLNARGATAIDYSFDQKYNFANGS